MPTKSPGLMSPIDALATPAIFHPGFNASALVEPSRVFTVSVDPSRLTIVPRTRTFSAAWAEGTPAIAYNATRAADADLSFIASILQKGLMKSPTAAAEVTKNQQRPTRPLYSNGFRRLAFS